MGLAGFLGTCGSSIWNCSAATAWQRRLPRLAQGGEQSWPAEEPGVRKPPLPGDGTYRLCQGPLYLTPSTMNRAAASSRARWWRACALKSVLGSNSQALPHSNCVNPGRLCNLLPFHVLHYKIRQQTAGSMWVQIQTQCGNPSKVTYVGKLLKLRWVSAVSYVEKE